jgi:hypothetical protein
MRRFPRAVRVLPAVLLAFAAACDGDSTTAVVAPPNTPPLVIITAASLAGIEPGQSVTLSAVGFGSGGAPTGETITWSSGTPAVATVSAAGVVTGVSAGTAVITARTATATGTLTIAVRPLASVRVNEVESNGGTPGDWIELINTGTTAVDVSGWGLRDNDSTRAIYRLPAGTSIPAGGYLVVEEAAFGFGLGAADEVNLFSAFNVRVDAYGWTVHAATTYGRCPNGSGAFSTQNSDTKGAVNDCRPLVRINEIESNEGTPGDWVELINVGTTPADLSGLLIKDNDDARTTRLPAGTILAPGALLVVEEATLGFGLGAADAVRIFDATTNQLIDSYTWTAHAATTYGRCPNGTGAFITTGGATKGAANDCRPAQGAVIRVNEVESNGGVPGDWVELFNPNPFPVDLSGWGFRDNDATRAFYRIPANTTIAAGGYYLLEEAAFGFGLGAADEARLVNASDLAVDLYSWTAHATTTYGRCPNGSGPFITTTTSTKGAANDCSPPVRINEVESNGGVPGDWIELINAGTTAVDISNWIVKDNDDTRTTRLPAGTTLAPGARFVIEESLMGFGLGAADAARIFDGAGTLIDGYTWTAHATQSYGRCPDGSGPFIDTGAPTKGTANDCSPVSGPTPSVWPGASAVTIADVAGTFGGNMSGLAFEAANGINPAVLWASKNGPGALYRLLFNGTNWVPDVTSGWTTGKLLRFPDGTGDVDAEGVTFAGASGNGVYIAAERNNAANGVSRNAILRYDASGTTTTLTATNEWNITADIPATGPNTGLEAITYVPDSILVNRGFVDESKARAYAPADYPNHAGGVFFVGVEQSGVIYAYVLNHTGNTFTKIATITTALPGVMGLEFDVITRAIWAVCDDGCGGLSAIFEIDRAAGSSTLGRYTRTRLYARPGGMANLNNEGFALGTATECVGGSRLAIWADDSETGGNALRRSTVPCGALPAILAGRPPSTVWMGRK